MSGAPVESEADRVASRERAAALSPDEVKPNKIGQFYFVLRQAAMQVPADSPILQAGLSKFQKDLSVACKDEGYSR
jgi:hypothetical protein